MQKSERVYPDAGPERERVFDLVLQAGRAGHSHVQIAGLLGISRINLKRWLRDHEDFAAVVKRADDFALAWWEALGQRHAETREGNAAMIMFVMRNRFERDYAKDTFVPPEEDPDLIPILNMSRKSRKKIRKVLRKEADKAKAKRMAKKFDPENLDEDLPDNLRAHLMEF